MNFKNVDKNKSWLCMQFMGDFGRHLMLRCCVNTRTFLISTCHFTKNTQINHLSCSRMHIFGSFKTKLKTYWKPNFNGPFPWNMLITFTYRPCWLANAIELCTKQTRNRVCVMHPLAVYKTARCSLILPTKTLVCTTYVQFTYFMERVYSVFFGKTVSQHAQCYPGKNPATWFCSKPQTWKVNPIH